MSMKQMMPEYQLRCAAGQYWLLDMSQEGVPYKQPMMMNSMGAEIWTRMEQGMSGQQIAEALSQEYDADIKEIEKDILAFQKQLIGYGVTIEE